MTPKRLRLPTTINRTTATTATGTNMNPKTIVGAEIVHDLPVKNPLVQQTVPPQPKAIEQKDEEDRDLDVILKDVNTSVKQAENSPEERFGHLTGVRRQTAIKKAKLEETHHGSPPILATVLAILVAAGLITAVLMVYK